MANMKNAKWVVKSHPEADLSEDNFELIYDEVPEPDAGQVLIKTKTLVICHCTWEIINVLMMVVMRLNSELLDIV